MCSVFLTPCIEENAGIDILPPRIFWYVETSSDISTYYLWFFSSSLLQNLVHAKLFMMSLRRIQHFVNFLSILWYCKLRHILFIILTNWNIGMKIKLLNSIHFFFYIVLSIKKLVWILSLIEIWIVSITHFNYHMRGECSNIHENKHNTSYSFVYFSWHVLLSFKRRIEYPWYYCMDKFYTHINVWKYKALHLLSLLLLTKPKLIFLNRMFHLFWSVTTIRYTKKLSNHIKDTLYYDIICH